MRDKVYITFKAKLDTATAIIAICRMIFIATTSFSIRIGLVLRPSALTVPHFGAFGDKASGGTQTTARLGIARRQTITQDINDAPAVAFSIPMGISMRFSGIPQDGQAAKLRARSVDKSPMRWFCNKFNSIFSVVHSVFSYQKMVWVRLAEDSQGLWRAVFIVSNPMQMCIRKMQGVA